MRTCSPSGFPPSPKRLPASIPPRTTTGSRFLFSASEKNTPWARVHRRSCMDRAVVATMGAHSCLSLATNSPLPVISGATEIRLGTSSRIASASASVRVGEGPSSSYAGRIVRFAPPSCRKLSMIRRCTPSARPSIAVTERTPMMIPNNVRAVRSLFDRNARIAVRTPSRSNNTGAGVGVSRLRDRMTASLAVPDADRDPLPPSDTTRPSRSSMRRCAYDATPGSWVTRMIV